MLEDARSIRDGVWRMARYPQEAAELMDDRIGAEDLNGRTVAWALSPAAVSSEAAVSVLMPSTATNSGAASAASRFNCFVELEDLFREPLVTARYRAHRELGGHHVHL
jgi:hypothetical protein